MIHWDVVTEGFARDIEIGGLSSPLLSWLAAGGLLLFFGWQATRLFRDVSRATAAFTTVRPLLATIAPEGDASDLQGMYKRAVLHDKDFFARGSLSGTTDMDRLTKVDTAMSEIEGLRRPWVQFRQTLLIERAPWFKEPRVYSTRGAEEFFTADKVLAGSIDLAFYGQVPSLITGFGLLLTFVALCIGLSRLHADASTITGVQGLINGLAGKFLTSIVALIGANLFIMLERPAVRRLHGVHREFVTLLDEAFPRRTVEDLVDSLVRYHIRRKPDAGSGDDDPLASEIRERLSPSIEELAVAVRLLSARLQELGELDARGEVVSIAGGDRRLG